MTTPGGTPSKLSELTGDYLLDTTGSKLGFVVPTMVVAKVRGQFDEFEGTAHPATGSGSPAGVFIGDRVTLELDITAVNQ